VPYIDPETGERVLPEVPNAVKLERFIFDALPLAERSIILENRPRRGVCADQKRRGSDSPETSKKLQVRRAARGSRPTASESLPDGRGRRASSRDKPVDRLCHARI
jgi:UDP-N-acetylglucosamine/UDP-N-acetylgalactosamine diphosphorylase